MRRFLIYIIGVLFAVPAFAEGRSRFTTLDWQELHIDSMLPVYSEVVPLETDYRSHTYSVLLEYPEFAPLSRAEAQAAARFDSQIGDTFRVESHVGVLRRQGMMDISFVPIVRRNGRYEKLLSARITIVATPKARPARVASRNTGRYADHSVLATGRWVKISITEDGMYRLTRSALKKMGFGNPANVHLYGYGGHRQSELLDADRDFDDLEEVPLYYSSSLDAWLFWGNGLLYWNGNTRVVNNYANAACYFLTETDQPSQIQTVTSDATPQGGYNDFTDHVLYEKDEYAWYHGGRELYENVSFANSSTRTYKLSTQDSQGQEQLTVAFSNGAASQTVLQPNVNGSNLSEISLSATAKYIYATEATRTYDVRSYSQGADWTVRLTSTAGNEARLNYLALHYSRQLTPRQGYVCFSREARPAQFNITGTGLQVMRIGERGDAACLMTGTQDGITLRVTVDDASRRYVAFDPSYSFPQPNVVGEVANQDLHGLDSLDMVILIPSSGKLRAQAERLADAHRQYDQLRVAVLTANQVYNEFSSGTPDATAYRRFMKMLYDRAASGGLSPRYLLLFGDCAWDNRMISTAWRRTNPDDYLLCFESDNSVSATRCFVMEDYFGLLDDGEGGNLLKDKCDLGVGRFPVVTASQAKVMVDKTIAFLSNQNAGSWRNVVCMMGDDGDENEHMRYSDDVAERILQDNPSMEVRKVMWDAYTRVSTTRCNTYPEVVSLLKKQMDEGALVMNYCGHANATSLSHELVLMLEDFQAFRGTRLPLWLTAACDVMPFDGATDNIGETAVLNENGAALAFYGTTRTVYATQNLAMNRYFMHYLFASDAAGQRYRVGDAVCLAKNDIITDGGSDLSAPENKLHYALLGDPALTFGAPRQKVTLDSINGQAVDGSEIVTLKAGQHVRFSGSVRQADGSLLPVFRGVVSARLFDSLHKITCKNNAGATTSFSFSDRGTALYTAQDSVRDGHFSLSFIVPLDIANGVTAARLLFYALSADATVEASGYSEDFVLGDVSDELGADTLGPAVYAYLRNEDFQNGDVVNAEPYFVAQLEDESGVSVSGNGVGHDLQLCIDGRADQTYNLNDYYVGQFGDFTRGTVAFSIPRLEAGPHSLTFRAWDVLNNTSLTSLDFVVNPSLKPDLLALTATQNPAITSTTFVVSYDFPGADCTFTLDVFDFSGRCVWTKTEVGSSPTGQYRIPWNLSTGAGGRLGSGIYLYRCTIQCGSSKKVSKTQKIVVLNNK